MRARLVAASLLLASCGTVVNMVGIRLPPAGGVHRRAFGGVVLDVWTLGALLDRGPLAWLLLPVVVVDLPLSLVGDLVTWPFTRSLAAPPQPDPGPAQPFQPLGERLTWLRLGPPGPAPAFEPRDVAAVEAAAWAPWASVATTASGAFALASVQGRWDRGRDRDGAPAVIAAEVDLGGEVLLGHRDELVVWPPLPAGGTPLPPRRGRPWRDDWPATIAGVARAGAGVLVERRGVVLVVPRSQGEEPRWVSGGSGPFVVLPGGRAALGLASRGAFDLRVWDLDGRYAVGRVVASAPVTAVAVVDSATVVVGCLQGAIHRRSLAAPGDRAEVLAMEPRGVLALAVSPDGAELAAASAARLAVYDLRTGRLGATAPAPARVTALAWDVPDRLVVADLEGAVRLLDAGSGAEVDRLDLRPLDDAAVAVRLTRDGALVVVTRCGLVLRYERA